MSRKEELEQFPKTGTLCAICKKPQYDTPSGYTCEEPGHGGADSIEIEEGSAESTEHIETPKDDEFFDQIAEVINSHVDLIAITPKGLAESRDRAAKFLVAQALLTSYLKAIDENLTKYSALKDAAYAQAIRQTDGKNVTEKKIGVGSNKGYREMLQTYEHLTSIREWIKGHIKIFENAHILYRGFSRE